MSTSHATATDPFQPAQEALARELRRLEDDPRDAMAWSDAAQAMLALGQRDDAIHALRQAASLRSDPRLFVQLGSLLSAQGTRDEPEAWFRRAVKADPTYLEGWLLLGYVRLADADTDEAGTCFATALELDPHNGDAAAGGAEVLDRRGRSGDAWRLVQEAVSRRWSSARLGMAAATVGSHTGHEEEALVIVRQSLRRARPQEALLLRHAQGDLNDRLGRHQAAWTSWEKANAARELTFDPERHLAGIDAVIAATQTLPEPTGPADERPVFVVGMPRSGTTLVERMLASHPAIHGVGELETLRDVSVALARQCGGKSWLHAAGELDLWSPVVGRTYLSALDRLRPGDAARIVDKMPNNALHLGLAATALPHARFVWCVRDDDDVALSCFSKALSGGLPWAASMAGIRAWQEGLRRLHAHWSQVMRQPILTLRYEDLVSDPEAQTKRLLEHVGLPWDPAVLQFHEHAEGVKTSSWDQVRQPLHRRAVNRAAPYRPFMGD